MRKKKFFLLYPDGSVAICYLSWLTFTWINVKWFIVQWKIIFSWILNVFYFYLFFLLFLRNDMENYGNYQLTKLPHSIHCSWQIAHNSFELNLSKLPTSSPTRTHTHKYSSTRKFLLLLRGSRKIFIFCAISFNNTNHLTTTQSYTRCWTLFVFYAA